MVQYFPLMLMLLWKIKFSLTRIDRKTNLMSLCIAPSNAEEVPVFPGSCSKLNNPRYISILSCKASIDALLVYWHCQFLNNCVFFSTCFLPCVVRGNNLLQRECLPLNRIKHAHILLVNARNDSSG